MSLRRWQTPLKLALTGALLASMWWAVGDGQVLHRLAELRPLWLAAGAALGTVGLVATALRWRHTAACVGLTLSPGLAIRELYLSTFLNQILPSGVAGDAVRAWRHGRSRQSGAQSGDDGGAAPSANHGGSERAGDSSGDDGRGDDHAADDDRGDDNRDGDSNDDRVGVGPAVRTVLIERFSNLLVSVPLALLSMTLWPALPGALPAARVWAPLTAAAIVLAALVGAFALLSRRAGEGAIQRFMGDFRLVWLTRRGATAQLGLGLAVIAAFVGMFACAAAALSAPISAYQTLALIPPILVSMTLPISYGGWGPREATAVALFTMAGLPGSDALTISIVYGAIALVSSLPGALVLLFDR